MMKDQSINDNLAQQYSSKEQAKINAAYKTARELHRNNQLNEAVEAYERIAVEAPFPDVYFMLGNARTMLGNIDGAIEAYEQAVSMDPNYTEAFSNLGLVYFNAGNFDKAEQVAQKAVTLDGNIVQSHVVLGQVYSKTSEFDKAIESFKKALTLKPEQEHLLIFLGALLLRTHRYDEAKEVYGQLAKMGNTIGSHFLSS